MSYTDSIPPAGRSGVLDHVAPCSPVRDHHLDQAARSFHFLPIHRKARAEIGCKIDAATGGMPKKPAGLLTGWRCVRHNRKLQRQLLRIV